MILCSADHKVQARWGAYLKDFDELLVCENMDQLLAIKDKNKGAILLLQLGFPDVDEPSFIQKYSGMQVIVCADEPNDEEGTGWLKDGAYGYCNTWVAKKLLLRIVGRVQEGEVWVGQSLILHLINGIASNASSVEEDKADCLADLTKRECEVAKLVSQGNSNKKIAGELGITERTVKAHLSAIFQKTGCTDRVQLALRVNQ